MDYKIEVVIDGKRIPIPSYDKFQEIAQQLSQWEEAKHRLDAYVESEASKAPSVETSHDTSAPSFSDRSEPSTKPDAAASGKPPVGLHERAWARLGRPAAVEEIFQSALDMGYIPRSAKPLLTFKRAIYSSKRFRAQGFTHSGEPLLILAEWGTAAVELTESSLAPQKPARAFGFSVPPGQQAADYAKRALQDAKHGLRIDELVDAMLKAGWKTSSPTPEARRKSAAAAVSYAKDLFIKRDWLWELVEWQNNKLAE